MISKILTFAFYATIAVLSLAMIWCFAALVYGPYVEHGFVAGVVAFIVYGVVFGALCSPVLFDLFAD